jgi:hypothetical protein
VSLVGDEDVGGDHVVLDARQVVNRSSPASLIAVLWPNSEASRANSADNVLKLQSRE